MEGDSKAGNAACGQCLVTPFQPGLKKPQRAVTKSRTWGGNITHTEYPLGAGKTDNSGAGNTPQPDTGSEQEKGAVSRQDMETRWLVCQSCVLGPSGLRVESACIWRKHQSTSAAPPGRVGEGPEV